MRLGPRQRQPRALLFECEHAQMRRVGGTLDGGALAREFEGLLLGGDAVACGLGTLRVAARQRRLDLFLSRLDADGRFILRALHSLAA